MTTRKGLFVRMTGDLHQAVEEAANAAGTTSAGWVRDLVAEILGTAKTAPVRSFAKRPKVRPMPPRQALLRQAVASLGALGSALDAQGADPALIDEVRQAVREVVDRVRRS